MPVAQSMAVDHNGEIVTANLAFDGSFSRVGTQLNFGVGETDPQVLPSVAIRCIWRESRTTPCTA